MANNNPDRPNNDEVTLFYSTNQTRVTGKPSGSSPLLRKLGYGWLAQAETAERLLERLTVTGEVIAPAHYETGRYATDNRDDNGNKMIWCPGDGTGHKSRKHFLKSNVYFADYDNDSSKKQGSLSWDQAQKSQLFRDHALFAYTTPSHQIEEGVDRFRVAFRLADVISSDEEYTQHHRAVCLLLPGGGFDRSMGPAQCVFGNTSAEVFTFNMQNVLPIQRLSTESMTKTRSGISLTDKTSRPEASTARLRSTLELINSGEYCTHETWKTVCSCIRNLEDQVGGEDAGVDLWLSWCEKDDYPNFDPSECERLYQSLESQPEMGGWGRLERLAGIAIEEPVQMTAHSIDELFGSTPSVRSGGRKIDSIKVVNSLTRLPDGKIQLLAKDNDSPIDLTYAMTTTVRNNHMLPLLRAIQSEHRFAYDTVNRAILLDGVEISEARLKTIHLDLSANHCINFPKTETIDGITRLALENQFDPFQEQMRRIEREVEPIQIDNMSSRFLGTSDPLYDLYLERWLVAFVGRQLRPGLYYRHMLVLQGRQNIGKDAMGRILSGDRSWTTVGSRADFDNRDFLISAHSKNLLNFDELERTTKHVVEGSLKSFLSNSEDSFVAKYSNQSQTYPRRFSCWGSCNQGQFLTDLTGNSRFHVIPVAFDRARGEMIDLQRLTAEREQILAGAIQLYREYEAGRYSLELTAKELQRSEELNKSYTAEAPFVEDLEDCLQGRTTITLNEVYGMLKLDNRNKIDRRIENAVKTSLSELGYSKKDAPIKVSRGGKEVSARVWTLDGCKPDRSELVEARSLTASPF